MGEKIIENGFFSITQKRLERNRTTEFFVHVLVKGLFLRIETRPYVIMDNIAAFYCTRTPFMCICSGLHLLYFFSSHLLDSIVVQVFSLDREIGCNLKRREQNKSDQFLSPRLHYIYFSIAGFMVYASFDRILVQKFFVPFGIRIPRRN